MPKTKLSHWETAFKIASGMSLAGVIGVAVTVGIYKQKVDRMIEDIDTFKIIHDIDKRLSIMEALEKARSNHSAPLVSAPVSRPAAGKQR